MQAKPFEAQSQSAYLQNESGQVVGHVSLGGAILKMPCRRKVQHFELHSYFGPIPCNRNGDHSLRVASDFWQMWDAWVAGGRLVDGDECVIQTGGE